MKSSSNKEVLTMIISGAGTFVSSFGFFCYVYFLVGGCTTIGLFIGEDVFYNIGWKGVDEWPAMLVIALILSGYGALVGRIGFKDYSSVKKLSLRTVVLIIVGVLAISIFLFPVCF